jgi:putative NADPH-quinone reductase
MKIVIIQGHPDRRARHFGHALADAYARGAKKSGHEVRRVEIARLAFPLLTTKAAWDHGSVPRSLLAPQKAIDWADHLVLIFPLWLGTMPAVVKGFLEQVLRPGFAFRYDDHHAVHKGLTRKSARVIVTMGMPSLWYRLFFRAQGVRGLERGILGFCGIKPVRETLIGLVEHKSPAARKRCLERIARLGRKAT